MELLPGSRTERTILKAQSRPFFFVRTNTRFCSSRSRLLVSLCLIVCLFVSCSCSRTKAAASILPLSKNFPTCPLHCGCQPTNQRHAASRQRGFDANLQTSNNHYWWFACLPGTVQNKMAPHRTLPQYGCIVWRWALLGNLKKRKRRFRSQKTKKEEKKHARLCDPAEEFYFVFAKVSTQKIWGERRIIALIRSATSHPSELNSPAKENIMFSVYSKQ